MKFKTFHKYHFNKNIHLSICICSELDPMQFLMKRNINIISYDYRAKILDYLVD